MKPFTEADPESQYQQLCHRPEATQELIEITFAPMRQFNLSPEAGPASSELPATATEIGFIWPEAEVCWKAANGKPIP